MSDLCPGLHATFDLFKLSDYAEGLVEKERAIHIDKLCKCNMVYMSIFPTQRNVPKVQQYSGKISTINF